MKKRFGCMFLLIGGLVGYLYAAFESRYFIPYIDRAEAIRIGLAGMQNNCRQTRFTHPVNCHHFTIVDIEEDKRGWWITYRSADGRREGTKRIGRRGEYDSAGYENLDGWADIRTQNSPAPVEKPLSKRTQL